MTNDGLDKLFADLPTILTPEEVADLLRMTKAAIYRWLNEGDLPGHKVGQGWRILRDDLHQWMQQNSNSYGHAADQRHREGEPPG